MDEEERKGLLNQIKASRSVLKLVQTILEEKITNLEGSYVQSLTEPSVLSGKVQTVIELKKLTKLFEETTND
jgi:hypothetical protein